MSMTPVSRRKEQLEKRLNALDKRLHIIEDTLDQPATKDAEDWASEHEEDEVLEGLGQAGLIEIPKIKAALDRIEAGVYGICQKCGNDITDDRLNILPQTPFCRTCAV